MSDSTDDVVFEPDTEETGDAAALAVKLKKVKADLAAATKEKEEYLIGWQRSKADYVNARKRGEDDLKSLKNNVIGRFAEELIPIVDSFDQALSQEGGHPEWAKGFENVRSQLLNALKAEGIEQFSPNGEAFNPSLHEAVEVVAAQSEKDDNRVLAVLQKGYILGERVLRPARVRIGHIQ